MTPLKPFQGATVDAAVRVLMAERGPKRFLVADEVGLGKTVVAQHVIARMMEETSRPLRVFYVCSNLTIAAQNRRNLLKVLPTAAEREEASCNVDRLTLLPAEDPPKHKRLHLYTLTPDTSIPMRQGRRRDGRQEERALIFVLLEAICQPLADELGERFFRRNAGDYWKDWVKYQRGKATDSHLQTVFRNSVRKEFGLNEKEWLSTKVRAVLEEHDELEIIARFRNALAAGALDNIHPDLVIFDEFQRFRDLTQDRDDVEDDIEDIEALNAAQRVIRLLQGGEGSGTALLLLSATPYSLYSRRWEDAAGKSHHAEFFELVQFLNGSGSRGKVKRNVCEEAFSEFAAELHKGEFDAERAIEARSRIESVLRPVMSRTERSLLNWRESGYETRAQPAPIVEADLKVFRHFAHSLALEHRCDSVTYWNSIPLPMQTMGSRYVVWEKSVNASASGIPALSQSKRDGYQAFNVWPHPRLRALMDLVPSKGLSVPWVAPSLPWWKPGGAWRRDEAALGKVLVFSRFRAVPQAVAAALSYDMECRTVGSGGVRYADVSKRRLLTATGKRYPILAMFHPSPFFCTHTDPLTTGREGRAAILDGVRRQLVSALGNIGIEVKREGGRPRPSWALIAQIDSKAGNGSRIASGWRSIHSENSRRVLPEDEESGELAGGLGNLISEWENESRKDLEFVTSRELEELALYAMSAPGVVFARALSRHWAGATDAGNYKKLLFATWNGLRTYLDQRWFMRALGAHEKNYLKVLQRAVLEGNFEAVLDEYFWYLADVQGLIDEEIYKEFMSATQLHSGDVRFHDLADREKHFTVRCHAAMPFIDGKATFSEGGKTVERPLRTDEMRRAFNSPFMPHVLVTTSVGQEGLDFHPWCRTLVHWDLSSNPVDVEQREGRIQRYAGLTVRRQLAEKLGSEALNVSRKDARTSPWRVVADMAEKRFQDESGLAPWWTFGDADIERYVLDVPTSEQRQRLLDLKEQRFLYRLALGQPNQEDFLDLLRRNPSISKDKLLEVIPRLSAWSKVKSGT
jgi:hypothetical protein